MRENRPSGSEGGGSESNRFSLPLSRRAPAAWSEFWEAAVALAAENREQFQEHCQNEKEQSSTGRRPGSTTV